MGRLLEARAHALEGSPRDGQHGFDFYDLGVRGDYEGLYAWLDAHGAKECGDSLAVLIYHHEGELLDKLKADLKKHVTTDERTRIYVVYRDQASGKNKGGFIFGGRRAAIWTGYAPSDLATVDEEDCDGVRPLRV